MSWLDAPKSEHEVRRQHFVFGVETGIESERDRILDLMDAFFCAECQETDIDDDIKHDECMIVAKIQKLISETATVKELK